MYDKQSTKWEEQNVFYGKMDQPPLILGGYILVRFFKMLSKWSQYVYALVEVCGKNKDTYKI